MKIENIYALIAPFASPIAVATVTGAAVYSALASVPDLPPLLVTAGAIAFAVAVEVSGGLAFAVIARAFANRSGWAAFAGVVLVVIYLGTIILAANVGAHGGVLMATGALPVVAYGGQSAWAYLERIERAAQKQRAEQMADRERAAELERLRLQAAMVESNNAASIARANARAVAAERSGAVRDVRANTPNSRLDPERLRLALEAFAANPSISAREMAAKIGSSSSDTGYRYLVAVSSGDARSA